MRRSKLLSRLGMSLVEVMMAVGILSIAILGVLSTVAFGLRAASYGQRVTEATNHARQITEIMRSQGLAWLSPGGGYYTVPPATEQIVAINSGAPFANIPDEPWFQRSIQVEQVGATSFDAYLYKITVTVYFYERGSRRQVQMVSVSRRPR